MINWGNKAVQKLELIDSCSYGELWHCELLAKIDEEIELFGGKLYWFFYRSVKKWNAKLRYIKNRGCVKNKNIFQSGGSGMTSLPSREHG